MKTTCFFPLLILIFFSIGKSTVVKHAEKEEREIILPEFQKILDSAHVKGALLVYDPKEDLYYSNDFAWAQKGNLPASTFKITHAIIALETAIVKNDSTLFKWDRAPRTLKIWEQDLTFKEAFHVSCVPCFQEIARKIELKNMVAYLDKLNYGDMQVDATNIDLFWLEGASQINQFQQIDFLMRFYFSELPISKRTEVIMKRMMLMEEKNGHKISGKTGWSITNGSDNGWFVGYVESQNKTLFFATNVEPKEQFNMELFPTIRKDVTYKALEHIIQNK